MIQQQAVLSREADLQRADRGKSASTTRLVNQSCGSRLMINGITKISPRGTILPHYHNCEETVLVLSGRGIAVVGETELVIKTADVTSIPADLLHPFRNRSDSDNMRIFWTYASAVASRTLVKTGETHLIDAEHKA